MSSQSSTVERERDRRCGAEQAGPRCQGRGEAESRSDPTLDSDRGPVCFAPTARVMSPSSPWDWLRSSHRSVHGCQYPSCGRVRGHSGGAESSGSSAWPHRRPSRAQWDPQKSSLAPARRRDTVRSRVTLWLAVLPATVARPAPRTKQVTAEVSAVCRPCEPSQPICKPPLAASNHASPRRPRGSGYDTARGRTLAAPPAAWHRLRRTDLIGTGGGRASREAPSRSSSRGRYCAPRHP